MAPRRSVWTANRAGWAVHPTEAQTIAVATRSGLFLSRDGGNSFSPIAAGSRETAVLFAAEGDALVAGLYDGEPSLARIAMADGKRQRVSLPLLRRHEVAEIAQNPVRRMELALVSSERAVFVSLDAGRTWRRIAPAREGLQQALPKIGTPLGRAVCHRLEGRRMLDLWRNTGTFAAATQAQVAE